MNIRVTLEVDKLFLFSFLSLTVFSSSASYTGIFTPAKASIKNNKTYCKHILSTARLTQNNKGCGADKVAAPHNAEGVHQVGQTLLHCLHHAAADIPRLLRHEAGLGGHEVTAHLRGAVSPLLQLRQEGPDHNRAKHEAKPHHGVQRLTQATR